MAARIMRRHGEYCGRCHSEIQIGERWHRYYRYDGVRRIETREIYHFDLTLCDKNLAKLGINKG